MTRQLNASEHYERIYVDYGDYIDQMSIPYTNSLYLLPDGRYGNANEAGDYFIGFAFGRANSAFRASTLAQLHAF